MRGREEARIGVLQLINALDADGNICEFSGEMALVLESIASQAAITIQNVRYIREIRDRLEVIRLYPGCRHPENLRMG